MSRRLQRQANRLQWKPYRAGHNSDVREIGPQGEEWELDAGGNPLRPVHESGTLEVCPPAQPQTAPAPFTRSGYARPATAEPAEPKTPR